MKDDVLTTTQVAAMLGVSVRTVQLLIESGAIASWKTPGGHRRVYRSDVKAFMAQTSSTGSFSSAFVVVLVSEARERVLEKPLLSVQGATVEIYNDPYAAYFAIGSRLPAVVVVDLEDNAEAHTTFLYNVASNPALGHTRIVTVAHRKGPLVPVVPGRTGTPVPVAALAKTVAGMLRDSTVPAAFPSSNAGFPFPSNEGQRLVALERSGLVDTSPEESFDRLTWLASEVTGAPIALMALLTHDRQWFKSRHGLDMTESPRSWAFCNHTIMQDGVSVVEDLTLDPRYSGNPVVVGEPHFRFYAGAPIKDPDGFALGVLCVVGYEPRALSATETRGLAALAAMASDEVRLRATTRQLQWASEKLNRRSA